MYISVESHFNNKNKQVYCYAALLFFWWRRHHSCVLAVVHSLQYIQYPLVTLRPWVFSLSFLLKAAYKYRIQSLQGAHKLKERHTGKRAVFFLLLLIPRESDCWMRRLFVSNKETVKQEPRAAFCKQNIKAQFFPCTLLSPPNICPLRPVSLTLKHFLQQRLSPSSLCRAFSSYLSSVYSSVAAIISAAAGSYKSISFSSPP